jgi:hypothetical protein
MSELWSPHMPIALSVKIVSMYALKCMGIILDKFMSDGGLRDRGNSSVEIQG